MSEEGRDERSGNSVSPLGTVVYAGPGPKFMSKAEYLTSLGKLMAYSNFSWAIFQLCLLALNYYYNSRNFDSFPGVNLIGPITVHDNEFHTIRSTDCKYYFGVLEMCDNHVFSIAASQLTQLTFALVVYQSMHLVLAQMFLRSIKEVDMGRLGWFTFGYSLCFSAEVFIIFLSLCTLNYEMSFVLSCALFLAFKSYSILTAERIRNFYTKLLRQQADIARLHMDLAPKIIVVKKPVCDNRGGLTLV